MEDRFSELPRRVHSEGPQQVTVQGRVEVVVMSADEFRRLKGDLTGGALIAVMQAGPCADIEIEPGTDSGARVSFVIGRLLDTNIVSSVRDAAPWPSDDFNILNLQLTTTSHYERLALRS